MCTNWSITKLLSHLIIYGTDVLTAVNRANVNVSSDRHLWHDLVRRYNLYLDKATKFLLTLRKPTHSKVVPPSFVGRSYIVARA